jgi:hypothetical protein
MPGKEDSPPDLESALHADLLRANIDAMKDFCNKNDIPWPIDKELRSAIELAEGCFQQVTTCVTFVQDLVRLEYYFSKGDKTKAMLILCCYGSKPELLQKIDYAIEEFKDKEQHFKKRSAEIKKTILSPFYDCDNCRGTGRLETQEVFRDFGSPPQVIYRTTPCETCGGQGKIPIEKKLRIVLKSFFKKMMLALNLLSDNLESIANLPTLRAQRPRFSAKDSSFSNEIGE